MRDNARESGIELLRIVSILFIYYMHGIVSEGWKQYEIIDPFTYEIIKNIICTIGNTDITVFVLISGYFGIKYSARRAVRFHNIVWIYGVVLAILAIISGTVERSADGIKSILGYLFPIISGGRYNFMCHYFWLVLLSPWLNKLVDLFERDAYRKLLAVLAIAFSVIPTFLYFEIFEDTGKGFPYMVFIYLFGRYIATYQTFTTVSKRKWFVLLVVSFMMIIILNGGVSMMIHDPRYYFCRDCSLFILSESLALFYIFKSMTWHSKMVNRIAQGSLGALRAEGITRYIVNDTIAGLTAVDSFFAPISLALIGIRLMVGYAIELLRQSVFGKIDDTITEYQCRMIERVGSHIKSLTTGIL